MRSCRFCGSEEANVVTESFYAGMWSANVVCVGCGAEGPTVHCPGHEEAAEEAWDLGVVVTRRPCPECGESSWLPLVLFAGEAMANKSTDALIDDVNRSRPVATWTLDHVSTGDLCLGCGLVMTL